MKDISGMREVASSSSFDLSRFSSSFSPMSSARSSASTVSPSTLPPAHERLAVRVHQLRFYYSHLRVPLANANEKLLFVNSHTTCTVYNNRNLPHPSDIQHNHAKVCVCVRSRVRVWVLCLGVCVWVGGE